MRELETYIEGFVKKGWLQGVSNEDSTATVRLSDKGSRKIKFLLKRLNASTKLNHSSSNMSH